MACYLYLELEGIQRFVFASPKLKVIRGGSAVLDHFNRVQMLDLANEAGGELVVSAGGHCLVKGLSRERATVFAQKSSRMLRKRTDGQVGLSWGIAEDQRNWRATWTALREDQSRRALETPPAPPPLPPFVVLCSSCGIAPATALEDLLDRDLKPLCDSCRTRINEARELGRGTIWDRLRRYLGPHQHPGDDESFRKLLPEREFEDLAELGSRREYFAYLYCDGNGMGKLLREADSDEGYGKLSRRIDDALHKAVASAVLKYCSPDSRTRERFAADVLLLGGDDLVVALPADRGVAFATEVLNVFHLEAGTDLRLSAGLVIAPYTTPIAILQDVAKSLLESAKQYAYLDEWRQAVGREAAVVNTANARRQRASGYIDFEELASARIDVERAHAVTCRPYRLDDFSTLVERVRCVNATEVPRGRLHALAEALHGSEREARTTTQMIVGRANPRQQDALRALLQPLHLPAGSSAIHPFAASNDPGWDLPFELYPGEGRETHRWSAIPDALELIDHLGPAGVSA